jgi:hypothetical protein
LSADESTVTVSGGKKEIAAAIMAAVGAYLEEEERARLRMAPAARPVVPVSLWRAYGLWEAMRPRTAWRRRMV